MAAIPTDGHPNPFIRYREFLFPFRLAKEVWGCTEDQWTDIVESIDSRLIEIDGTGFHETPLEWSEKHQVRSPLFTLQGKPLIKPLLRPLTRPFPFVLGLFQI